MYIFKEDEPPPPSALKPAHWVPPKMALTFGVEPEFALPIIPDEKYHILTISSPSSFISRHHNVVMLAIQQRIVASLRQINIPTYSSQEKSFDQFLHYPDEDWVLKDDSFAAAPI
jgi:hypothetical protein